MHPVGVSAMVDLSTALAAAAASDKRRGGRDGDKKRPGGKVGTEPFDPADHVVKERADAASMWLVIVYAIIVGVIMRFVIMPAMDGPGNVLWSLPLLLIFTIPSIHRILLKKFADRYTFGNWFRATFLYTFTWLAICMILVNPPIADISPPEIAENTVLVDLDTQWNNDIGDVDSEDNLTEIERLGIAFAIRDNVDPSDVNVSVEITWDGGNSLSYSGDADDQSWMGEWDDFSDNLSNIESRPGDVPILIELVGFNVSINTPYTITITLSQTGDPWELQEVYTHRLIVNS